MRVNLALMNVKGSLAGRKTSLGTALQTLGTGLCQGRVPWLAELPAPPEQGTGLGMLPPIHPVGLGCPWMGKQQEKPSQAGVEVPEMP